MKKLLALFLALCLLPCASAEGFDLASSAQTVCSQLLTGDYDAVVSAFDETMASALTAETLAQTMQSLSMQYGALEQVTDMQLADEQNAVVFTLAYTNGALLMSIVFDHEGQVSGLFLQPAPAAEATEKPLPEGAEEISLTLFAGTERELGASLVRPADAACAYAIFVHGSGASDRDETIGPNKPFRDLAYDLAQHGIGSLRFDKITYAHPELSCETVLQEYLEPVTEAIRVLKTADASAKVYLIGHSEGGMLAPWLVTECGFDGAAVLAGTPKALWEIQWMQNLSLMPFVPQEQQAAQQALIDAELEKALRLMDLPDDETVFGISAVYHRSIAALDEIELVKDSQKPFLFLWGDCDVQVDKAAFEAWQDGLNGYGQAQYIVYQGLNHLFLTAQEGDSILNVQAAYSRPETVPAKVAQDIAEWIKAQ